MVRPIARLPVFKRDRGREKPIIWIPEKLKAEIKLSWPFEARKEVGFELGNIQQGLEPSHYREMPT
ncbi:MAG: hypothetical protein KGS72_29045, partial [Cyanobacteria bacterium REEB67]|nr:hypothetical protein [Cyanobacteria bacterium REEB67]